MWCAKNVSRLKLYLPRQKWTMNKTLISFKILPLAFNTTHLPHCSLVEESLKLLFWYFLKLHHLISFNVLYIFKSLPRYEFSVKEKKSLPSYLLIAVGVGRHELIVFLRSLAWSKTHIALSRITDYISCDNNSYTKCTSMKYS